MPVKLYRIAHWLWLRGVPVLPELIEVFNRIVVGVALPPSSILGKGVSLSCQGRGTAIHQRAVIGEFVVLGAGATIGRRSGHTDVPFIGDRAMIGAGAKVLGPVRVGRFASVGANAVVLSDIPDYGVAVGIPARVIKCLAPDEVPDYFAFEKAQTTR